VQVYQTDFLVINKFTLRQFDLFINIDINLKRKVVGAVGVIPCPDFAFHDDVRNVSS